MLIPNLPFSRRSTVLDTSGTVVANASVTVKNNGTNEEETVMTDETGYFRAAKLQPGSTSRQIQIGFRFFL
jgi:hypothetical protein